MSRLLWLLAPLYLGCIVVSPVQGHEIRPAYLKISELTVPAAISSALSATDSTDEARPSADINYRVLWKQPLRAGESLHLEPVLPDNCQELARSLGTSTAMALTKRWTIACSGEGLAAKTIVISGLDSTIVDTFVEITFADGALQSAILRAGASSLLVDNSGQSSGSGIYLWLGIEHLLQGYDHILFIIGLVLLVRTPLLLLKVVTSFTVAHSITLALASFATVSLPQAPVEALIALSIVFLAVELRAPGSAKSVMRSYPWAITFVFGLLHGFGFAGALTEIGLPEEAAILALLLFNVGVELGQLIIVAVMLVLLAAIARLPTAVPAVLKRLPAYAIGTTAAFWFIERSLTVLQAY